MSEPQIPGNLSGTASIKFSASATISGTNDATGRFETCDKKHGVVEKWARRIADERLSDALCSQIVDQLKQVVLVRQSKLVCYRGKTTPVGAKAPTREEMGPPSAHFTRDTNRYSRKGRLDLYLCDSIDGLCCEFKKREGSLWVQEFEIPAAELRIADLSVEMTKESPLTRILWFTELGGEEGQPGRVGQEFSELAREQFDGLLV